MAQNSTPPHGPSSVTVKGKSFRLRTIGIGVLAVLAVWFIAVNTESVSITLWVATVTMPLWVVLTVTIAVGVIIGYFLGRRSVRR